MDAADDQEQDKAADHLRMWNHQQLADEGPLQFVALPGTFTQDEDCRGSGDDVNNSNEGLLRGLLLSSPGECQNNRTQTCESEGKSVTLPIVDIVSGQQ